MKRTLTLTTLLLFFAIGFTACEKIEKDTPPAIKKLIRQGKKEHTMSVIEYKCGEKIVYGFVPEIIPDVAGYIYDKDGNMLCQVGGFFGLNGCEKEYENCIERVIWTKK